MKALSSLILVVDDHAETREGCAAMLAQSGFRVVTAINGLDGLVKALTVRPDLIVMDLAMPDLDGLDCTRQLAASSLTREIPVIALTGHATPEAKEQALAAGCRGFVVKPFLPSLLIDEVGRLGGRPQSGGSAERSSA
ncbi:MAG TPA: response regulator [Vicinamibacteria bacterium]|nr:response regulator [Vicinamibacteria bacterium]